MEWFKMQTIWGASIERLSDAEAGRFIKAVYAYVRDSEEYHGGGKEEPTVFQALETLRKDIDAYKAADTIKKTQDEDKREKRRAAAKARWASKCMQKDANASTCMDKDANASTCTTLDANAGENKNIYIEPDNINNGDNNARAQELPFGLTETDIQSALERDSKIEDAAKSAGLPVSELSLITAKNYADKYGLDKLLDSIKITALNASKPSWAYVEGVLKGNGRKEPGRDHSGDHGKGERSGTYDYLFSGSIV